MKAVDTTKNFTSDVRGSDITIAHRVTSDDAGVQTIFSQISRGGAQLGYINHVSARDHGQIFFSPFASTTTAEKNAIVATALADIDELLMITETGHGGE